MRVPEAALSVALQRQSATSRDLSSPSLGVCLVIEVTPNIPEVAIICLCGCSRDQRARAAPPAPLRLPGALGGSRCGSRKWWRAQS